jgi:hypothetical protein
VDAIHRVVGAALSEKDVEILRDKETGCQRGILMRRGEHIPGEDPSVKVRRGDCQRPWMLFRTAIAMIHRYLMEAKTRSDFRKFIFEISLTYLLLRLVCNVPLSLFGKRTRSCVQHSIGPAYFDGGNEPYDCM